MQDFKKLKVWEKSHQLTLSIYKSTSDFPNEEKYGITSQLRRASSSVPANLAEGCSKISSKDKLRFFQIALGSIQETEYFCLLSKDLKYFNEATYKQLDADIQETKAMLLGLIKAIKSN